MGKTDRKIETMQSFRTHTGQIVKGKALKDALNRAADEYIKQAHDIRKEDAYASHVTEREKDAILKERLERAERIREGKEYGLWLWQIVNQILTGECVALLP